MPSIFTRIVKGEIPCYKIAEDENYFAFLDINPLSLGHTLVIPKVEIDYLFDLNDELLSGMMIFAKKISKAIEKSVSCERIGIAVIGLEVAHAHIHLVPLKNIGDLNFANPKLKLSAEEFKSITEKIKSNLN